MTSSKDLKKKLKVPEERVFQTDQNDTTRQNPPRIPVTLLTMSPDLGPPVFFPPRPRVARATPVVRHEVLDAFRTQVRAAELLDD